jgi:predicted DNA-binding antitoxin AbrB/MazE fold protein
MSQHLRAFYEDGVFRPLEPVRIEEHQEVTLVLETTEGAASGAAEEKPIWEVVADLVRGIPEDVLRAVPTDGAAQHDSNDEHFAQEGFSCLLRV